MTAWQVEATLLEGFDLVDINMWLSVIPQIIARISSPDMRVRKCVHTLLLRVGRKHPQALIYPLAVASHEARSHGAATSSRGRWAERILTTMRSHCDALVEQATYRYLPLPTVTYRYLPLPAVTCRTATLWSSR